MSQQQSIEDRLAALEAANKKKERLIQLQSGFIELIQQELVMHKRKICGLKELMDTFGREIEQRLVKFAKDTEARVAKAERAAGCGFITCNISPTPTFNINTTYTPSMCYTYTHEMFPTVDDAPSVEKQQPCAAAKSTTTDDDKTYM